MIGIHRATWKSRGWMTFTVPNGSHLRLSGAGGAGIVGPTPTGHLSAGNFLAAGIPQVFDYGAWRFAEIARDSGGHSIKHAIIEIMSSGATVDPPARTATDGSLPTTSLGRYRDARSPIEIHNSPSEIFNFDLFNRSGGDMVVEVEVFE